MSLYQYLDTAREQITRTGVSMFTEFVPSAEKDIPGLLNSSLHADVNQGLRSLLTMVADGKDVHGYFGYIVKNVHSQNIRTREMASALLIMYAQHEPELTLLIVNTVKRMLDDSSAVTRMQALHLFSALRVPTIAPIITHFITEVINDPSPLVRIATCQAIGLCYDLDPSLGDDMLNLLLAVLNSPRQLNSNTREAHRVVGWALAVLALYWPQRIDLLHQFFRLYVPYLAEFDEYCYTTVCSMLIRYCRHYMRGPEEEDCLLLVNSVRPLLNRMNRDVVVQTCAVVHYIGQPAQFAQFNIPQRLLALDRESPLVWNNILFLCAAHPLDFAEFRSRLIFSLSPGDIPAVRVYVVKCVFHIGVAQQQQATNNKKSGFLTQSEFNHLRVCTESWQDDSQSIRAALQTITALTSPERAPRVLKWLIDSTTNTTNSPLFVSEALSALRVFMQQQQNLADVSHLLARMATSTEILPSAKATLVWMVSMNSTTQPALSTEVLRQLLGNMANESAEVRLQILQLAAKLMTAFRNDSASMDQRVPQFFNFAIKVAHFDPEVDIRDRARLFSAVLNENQEDNSMASLLLQVQLPAPKSQDSTERNLKLNSAGLYLGQKFGVYSEIEGWGSEDTNTLRERKVEPQEPQSSASGTAQRSFKSPQEYTFSQSNAQRNASRSMSLEEFLSAPPSQSTAAPKASTESESESESGSGSGSEYESESEESESEPESQPQG